jgi:hypothetical protein
MSQMTEEMNCTDYKEALSQEPGFTDETGHIGHCEACKKYREELLAFDEQIHAA